MDEEMEDFIAGEIFSSEIDLDYEFDACRFFDLCRPESDSEAQEAERWFDSAQSYPPSPFIVKLNWGKDIPVEIYKINSPAGDYLDPVSTFSDENIDGDVSSSEVNTKGGKHHNHIAQDIMRVKTKAAVKSFKPKSSTLMKPTASHLAKQNRARDIHTSRGRLQKTLVKVDERSSQKSPGYESLATKRQKLEFGYMRKVAHLKHHPSMLHKIAKRVGQHVNSISSRTKVTVPREPDLETAQRAQRRSFRSKNNSELGQTAKQSVHSFKARPLNRKILQAPSLAQPKRSTPQLPEFQVFQLKTSERAMQHSSADVLNTHKIYPLLQSEDTGIRRPTSEDVLKQKKSETVIKQKGCPLDKEFSINKRLSQNPPTELFKKLSLKSESETRMTSQLKQHHETKGSKENIPSSFHEFLRSTRKPNQCGSDTRIPEVGCQPNINRRLDIR